MQRSSTVNLPLQKELFEPSESIAPVRFKPGAPFKAQLLKWVGNKQRFAHEIISYFPKGFNRFIEPFMGSGAVIGTLAPKSGIGSDILKPLVEIWQTLIKNPHRLIKWYQERFDLVVRVGKSAAYEKIRSSYNAHPNAEDLLFISRTCYGGVIRFRKHDGGISTPCGVHEPISPESFSRRVSIWHARLKNVKVVHADFQEMFESATKQDLIYCDPPYTCTQSILYGAQSFSIQALFDAIDSAKARGVFVALSIDGTKKSGNMICNVRIPKRLFKREVFVNCGRSMLRRFQLRNKTLESEVVADRLLLTW